MLWVWKGQTTKISCFVESSIKWYKMIFLVGCLNNRGLPIVRVQMIISWKVSARKLSPQGMNLFSKHDKQLVLFTVSFYRVVNIMFVFFPFFSNVRNCLGKTLWQFCLFSPVASLQSWHLPMKQACLPCFTSAQVRMSKASPGDARDANAIKVRYISRAIFMIQSCQKLRRTE